MSTRHTLSAGFSPPLSLLSAALALSLSACRPSAQAPAQPDSGPVSSAPAVVVPVISSDPVVQRVVEIGALESEVEAPLRHLTKTIGPRLTSSHALMRAERWAKERFAAYGLDEAYLERWGEYPVGFDRGPQSGGMVSPERIDYVFTTPAWSPGVSGPARGRAALYPASERALKANAETYRDAWVVRPRPKQGDAAPPPDPKVQRRIADRLRELGALGYISSDRDERGELVHTSGRKSIRWGALPDDVKITLRADQHADLVQRIEQGAAVELEFSIDNRFFRGPVQQYNVIGDIRGSERPDELVIIGGHLDSWDGAEGAVDNATGVATTLEAARILSEALAATGARPKRTIRFMLWSGEEQGLFGSRAYLEAHPELVPKISAVFVHDGGTNYLSGLSVTPEIHQQLAPLLAPLASLDPEKPFSLRLTDHLRPGSSDHDSFLARGVPGFFWHQDGASNYRCMHHTQLDVFEAAIDDYQRHSAIVVAVTAYLVANADALLDRSNAIAQNRRTLEAQHDWAIIEAVPKRGRARKLGLRKGDVIVSVDGVAVSTSSAVRRLLNTGAPTKTLKIRRGAREFERVVDFTDDPGEQAAARAREARKARFGADLYERIAAQQGSSHPLAGQEDSCAGELARVRGG